MSAEIVVAIIAAVSGIIGGIIGAIASPVGKDWVAKQAFIREEVRRASENSRAEEERIRASAEAAEARERAMYETLTEALEVWRSRAPFVELNASKAQEQFEAQETVRALAPRVKDDELQGCLTALVDGDARSFSALHDLAVKRLGEVVAAL